MSCKHNHLHYRNKFVFHIKIDPDGVAGVIFPYRVELPSFIPKQWQVLYMGSGVLLLAIQIVAVDYLNVTLINQIRFQLNVLNLSFQELCLEAKHLKETLSKGMLYMDIDSMQMLKGHGQALPNKKLNTIIKHHCLLKE